MGILGPEHITLLRAAVELSPENPPLRQALGEAFLAAGFAKEAVAEFRATLALLPEDARVKTELAKAFSADGKTNHALVIVEDLVRSPGAPANAHMLYARLLADSGEVEPAIEQYKIGIKKEPNAADPDLAGRLGLRADLKPQPNPTPTFQPLIFQSEQEVAEDAGVIKTEVQGKLDPIRSGVVIEIERPALSFEDVGGMESLKEEMRLRLICPLTHAGVFKAYGRETGGGVLMYGPPGCGKTLLARAAAGEAKAAFLAIDIHEVLDERAGNFQGNLQTIFEQARRNAPCVVFLQDLDALMGTPTNMNERPGRHLLHQLLRAVSSVKTSTEGVLVVAVTNAPWRLDRAFRRAGRFERGVFVPPPDGRARAAILRLLLRGKPLEDVDYDVVSAKCEGFSGDDLKSLVDAAIESKLREAIQSSEPRPISTKDLLDRVGHQKPTAPDWLAAAKNHALYSNQGGAYDEILEYLRMR